MRVLIAACLVLIACKNDASNVTSKVDAGTVIRAANVTTSFNEAVKTNVETTEGAFTVLGSFSALKGTQIWLVQFNNSRRRYLCKDMSNCQRVLGW